MLFDFEGYKEDLDYRCLAVSSLTPCKEAVELIVKKFKLSGKISDYFLMEVSEENEGIHLGFPFPLPCTFPVPYLGLHPYLGLPCPVLWRFPLPYLGLPCPAP